MTFAGTDADRNAFLRYFMFCTYSSLDGLGVRVIGKRYPHSSHLRLSVAIFANFYCQHNCTHQKPLLLTVEKLKRTQIIVCMSRLLSGSYHQARLFVSRSSLLPAMSYSSSAVLTNCHRASHDDGAIHMIVGPMFSGKSTELLRRVKRQSVASKRCLLIKYSKDTRYGLEGVITHDQQQSTAKACTVLEEARSEAADYDVIGIDEGQFFPDLVEFSEEMANEGKLIIIAALDGTFQRKPFSSVMELIPLAESVVKLSAVCMICNRDAAFSKRLGNETEVELIGGADKYIAVCRKCYFARTHETQAETPTATKPDGSDKALKESMRKLTFDD
eukprot:TRINITY_DN11541_c1_g2_i5.p1 TRINITY_DN11541_c1_g2~~TRINITY_DN11541_c1_g2_i5.p1  ORF type:complete len:331 (+),score=32.21 TRINITY_DN11541_c1_g2_i5:80-1072(+)